LHFFFIKRQKLYARRREYVLMIVKHPCLAVPSVYDFIRLSLFDSGVCFMLLVLSVIFPLLPRFPCASSLVLIPPLLAPSHRLTYHFPALPTSTIRRIRL
jgi:hypothetical protein